MSVKCFLVKETKWCTLYARRYDNSVTRAEDGHYHNAMALVGIFPVEKKMYGTSECNALPEQYETPKDSSLWPIKCEKCDYVFTDKDAKQDSYEVMYAKVASEDEDVSTIVLEEISGLITFHSVPPEHITYTPRSESGIITKVHMWWPMRELPPGAMWRCPWNRNFWWDNETEDPLYVMCPGGTEWNIDSRCNNCTLPQDKTHRCWVRTGVPPNITVGKSGFTCAAGAGSIATPNYHGMLTNGEFQDCGDSQIKTQ